MIEKSESNQLSLATAPILGQAPRKSSWKYTKCWISNGSPITESEP
ncbi:MAG: hypothetical protein GY792_27680 [Gammaproteobacteria bacterium]|nr:hypothetical protein [Gammaproteobacteria bacterium]